MLDEDHNVEIQGFIPLFVPTLFPRCLLPLYPMPLGVGVRLKGERSLTCPLSSSDLEPQPSNIQPCSTMGQQQEQSKKKSKRKNRPSLNPSPPRHPSSQVLTSSLLSHPIETFSVSLDRGICIEPASTSSTLCTSHYSATKKPRDCYDPLLGDM